MSTTNSQHLRLAESPKTRKTWHDTTVERIMLRSRRGSGQFVGSGVTDALDAIKEAVERLGDEATPIDRDRMAAAARELVRALEHRP